MSTQAPVTARISGVLRDEEFPDWNPHQTTTEEHAIQRIIEHMQRDALCVSIAQDTGPVHWHDVLKCWHAWGNFTIASGGFEITPLSEEGRAKLLRAWADHQQSEHYRLAVQIETEQDPAKMVALGKRLEEIYDINKVKDQS